MGTPLRSLLQRRDVTAFAQSAPIAAVQALLELLTSAPLLQVIGGAWLRRRRPTFDQRATAVDQMSDAGCSTDVVVALLTLAVGEAFPATPDARRLLEERSDLELPHF